MTFYQYTLIYVITAKRKKCVIYSGFRLNVGPVNIVGSQYKVGLEINFSYYGQPLNVA